MHDDARGGNDTLIGGDISSGPINILSGDAHEMYDNGRGGNDTLTGGARRPTLLFWRRLRSMHDNARGGNDTLTGGAFVDRTTSLGDAYHGRRTPAAAMTR